MTDSNFGLFPIVVEVEAGKTYNWCGCGKSKTPPFCDGLLCDKAVTYVATLNEDVYFCNCKQTKKPPFCDGSHARLLLDAIKKKQDKGS